MGHVYSFIDSKIENLVFSEFLPEMFRRVGLDGSDINDLTKLPNWFTSKQWTEKDEQEFKEWLVERIRYKVKLTKRAATQVADMFVLNYGWSTGVEKQLELPLDGVKEEDLI
jgi:hypothetical protein